jgi:hypothetical protein
VVDHTVGKREGVEARLLREVSGDVGAGLGRQVAEDWGRVTLEHRPKGRSHLRLCVRGAEVEVEITTRRGDPWDAPSHSLLVRLEPLEWCPRDIDHRYVARLKVRQDSVNGVGVRRACGTPGLVARAEHEVVHEQLRVSVEELRQALGALVGLESVLLGARNPRQLAALPRELVAHPCVLLLASQELVARPLPLLPGTYPVLSHRVSFLPVWPSNRCSTDSTCRSNRRDLRTY